MAFSGADVITDAAWRCSDYHVTGLLGSGVLPFGCCQYSFTIAASGHSRCVVLEVKSDKAVPCGARTRDFWLIRPTL